MARQGIPVARQGIPVATTDDGVCCSSSEEGRVVADLLKHAEGRKGGLGLIQSTLHRLQAGEGSREG